MELLFPFRLDVTDVGNSLPSFPKPPCSADQLLGIQTFHQYDSLGANHEYKVRGVPERDSHSSQAFLASEDDALLSFDTNRVIIRFQRMEVLPFCDSHRILKELVDEKPSSLQFNLI